MEMSCFYSLCSKNEFTSNKKNCDIFDVGQNDDERLPMGLKYTRKILNWGEGTSFLMLTRIKFFLLVFVNNIKC